MTSLEQLQARYKMQGAELAADGIPLHFGDQAGEYQAGLETAILLDRSHEGRFTISGESRFDILNRISTNDMTGLRVDEARATIFTNANARILDRIIAVNRADESLLVFAGPGRGGVIRDYLQRNIFFNDDANLSDLQTTSHQFALHGPFAQQVIAAISPTGSGMEKGEGTSVQIGTVSAYILRGEPISGTQWTIFVSVDEAVSVWDELSKIGETVGLRPSGGLVFNALRIRAGVPGIGRELSTEYIPLEVGLWDEISFSKGCYTGQEIIARMESRERLARTIVRLRLDTYVDTPSELFADGKNVGRITSSVTAPDGEVHAIGVIKLDYARPGTTLEAQASDGVSVTVSELLGVQPPFVVKNLDA